MKRITGSPHASGVFMRVSKPGAIPLLLINMDLWHFGPIHSGIGVKFGACDSVNRLGTCFNPTDASMLGKLIFFAGFAQLGIVIGSLAIPRVLKWAEDTAKLRPLTRQVFWTYAGYIWATNLSFAIVSIWGPESLIDGSFLATAVTVFIAGYWGARVVIQFTWFDKRDAPKGPLFSVAEVTLVSTFVFLTAVYSYAVYHNLVGQ